MRWLDSSYFWEISRIISIKKYLNDKDIPAGIDIVDEFDIPAFLRKKN